MRLPVALSAEAEADFDAAADWYQEQAGLGAKFTAQVRKILNQEGCAQIFSLGIIVVVPLALLWSRG